MSSRNVRKLFGTTTLPALEGNSDEEFEPLYAKSNGKPSKSTYAGLEVSSASEEQSDERAASSAEDEEESAQAEEKTKKKKKRKKQRKATKPEELDEIDRSVMEVNAILGGPPAPSTSSSDTKKPDLAKELFSVCSKHLNCRNEIKKMFGSDTPDEDGKAKKCRPHNVTKYRRACIIPTPDNYHYSKVGLSMSMIRKDNGISYFTYDHNREYQKMHQTFLDVLNPEDVVPIDDSRMNVHLEGLIESADFMLRTEEYNAANSILEQIIIYLQYAAHPSFNLTDQSIRLEYQYMENRPFFVAVLKYMYMLTNKACHRTALELAKLLLNLDPSDPLAVISVIDVLALRAREHQWLVDAVDFWSWAKDAKYLFNIKYSYALAHFHLVKKSKSKDFSQPDKMLKEAMYAFPSLTALILEAAKHEASAHIREHQLFAKPDVSHESPDKVRVAATLYAKLVCWKFREPAVMEWFVRNAQEVIDQYTSDPAVKERIHHLATQRQSLYATCPVEIHRHMLIVRPMANLLMEWDMPRMMRTRAWDPLPPANGVNRYNYGLVEIDPNYYTVLFNLFSSVMPTFVPPPVPLGADLRWQIPEDADYVEPPWEVMDHMREVREVERQEQDHPEQSQEQDQPEQSQEQDQPEQSQEQDQPEQQQPAPAASAGPPSPARVQPRPSDSASSSDFSDGEPSADLFASFRRTFMNSLVQVTTTCPCDKEIHVTRDGS